MLYLPGSALQLVPGVPHVVLSGEERDGAFIVVVTQKGFNPWREKTQNACQCVLFVVFNLTLIIPDKTIKSKVTHLHN